MTECFSRKRRIEGSSLKTISATDHDVPMHQQSSGPVRCEYDVPTRRQEGVVGRRLARRGPRLVSRRDLGEMDADAYDVTADTDAEMHDLTTKTPQPPTDPIQ